MFTVSVKYSGQPEQEDGDYPTRQEAAHAADLAKGHPAARVRDDHPSRWVSMSPKASEGNVARVKPGFS